MVYKNYYIEGEFMPLFNEVVYHIKKSKKATSYIKCYLTKHQAKCYITRKLVK